jgi:predicted SnoaL-like aldol condensation-catalyzing enzyme
MAAWYPRRRGARITRYDAARSRRADRPRGAQGLEPEVVVNRSLAFATLSAAVTLSSLAAPREARAQVPVTPAADHARLLASRDPKLAANKRLVYDFWRKVLEAGHLELAPQYLAERYVQHNPNVPTGRAGFVTFFGKFAKPKPIEAKMQSPLVAITAEGDRVVLAFASLHRDAADSTKTWTTTSFDMFRIAGGKIAEHWDADRKE